MKIDNKYTVKSTNVALIFITHSIGPCKIIDRFDNLAYYILTSKQENIEETIIIL